MFFLFFLFSELSTKYLIPIPISIQATKAPASLTDLADIIDRYIVGPDHENHNTSSIISNNTIINRSNMFALGNTYRGYTIMEENDEENAYRVE
jgi:hypothetical protein